MDPLDPYHQGHLEVPEDPLDRYILVDQYGPDQLDRLYPSYLVDLQDQSDLLDQLDR